MGSCLSKKKGSDSSPSGAAASALVAPQDGKGSVSETFEKEKVVVVETETVAVEESVKKEIFVIKHRKSHDVDKRVEQKGGDGFGCVSATSSGSEAAEMENNNGGHNGVVMSAAPVRTSSCTKEEVDAILIQCGRLSRSSSGKAGPGVSTPSKKYSGSKRSYDFDQNDCDFAVDGDRKKGSGIGDNIDCCDDDETSEKRHHRQRHRQSRASPQGRRRTPSRERDPNRQHQQQRSGSRDRGSSSGGGSGRRVSRSPGRRSDNPPTTSAEAAEKASSHANAGCSNATRPGKMVSVPATVIDKGNNGSSGVESGNNGAVRRVLVKRNSGEVAASGSKTPRSRSPANARVVSNENQNQHPSLSRNSSRKAEQSPYRRNPLSEIDPNINNRGLKAREIEPDCQQKPNMKDMNNGKVVVHGTNNRSSSRGKVFQVVEEAGEPKGLQPRTNSIETTIVVASGAESLKPQALTRTRSSRRSRDLDLNPETLLNPTPSYTTLLLEDIQNFHQKNTTTPSISLPACVSKAHSILEAVADLNSCTSSNPSYAFSDDRRNFTETHQNSMDDKNPAGKKRLEAKDPFVVESEIVVCNDLMEPSLHKYVTVKRGTIGGGGEMEEQESSGSNSFVGVSQLHSWEPNSADSTDCWTSRSNTREEYPSPVCFQRHALSEPGRESEETQKRMGRRKREIDHQQNGIGRGRLGTSSRGGGLHTVPSIAST